LFPLAKTWLRRPKAVAVSRDPPAGPVGQERGLSRCNQQNDWERPSSRKVRRHPGLHNLCFTRPIAWISTALKRTILPPPVRELAAGPTRTRPIYLGTALGHPVPPRLPCRNDPGGAERLSIPRHPSTAHPGCCWASCLPNDRTTRPAASGKQIQDHLLLIVLPFPAPRAPPSTSETLWGVQP